jgi:cytochrome c peroxidase
MMKKFRLAKGSLVTFLAVTTVAAALGGMTALQAQTQSFTCPDPGFADVPALPLVLLTSLKTVPNPVIPVVNGQPTLRADLVDFVANLPAAIQLGKALFWDMQAGSDNKIACATCHFQAGQDGRSRNQLNPGPNGTWDTGSVNADLSAALFPFSNAASNTTDNIAGSQGIRKSTFGGIGKNGTEQTTSAADPVYSIGGKNLRQVTGVNTPSVVNAVFNHRNFFNGRAQNQFNGVNPFGDRDGSARVWYVGPNGPTQIDIHISDASLASQAVGPPLNPVEMSAGGRSFPDLGHKLLALKPLGLQKVDPTDSVLGSIADPTKGLTATYLSMVQKAFKPKWWNTTKSIRLSTGTYTMTEANWSLFWGLSIMLYEATLVSDDTPIDRYVATRAAGSTVGDRTQLYAVANRLLTNFSTDFPGATRDDLVNRIVHGLELFEMPIPPAPAPNGIGCMFCHVGAELTSASIRNLTVGLEAGDIILKNGGFDQRMERMFMQLPGVPAGTTGLTLDTATWTVTASNAFTGSSPAPVATYDACWYNIGARPTSDEPGLDNRDPFGNYLSWTRMLQALSDPSYIKVAGAGLACNGVLVNNSSGYALLSGSLRKTENTDVAGTVKTPQLRNVELNGPYFHNGGKATLWQVLELYDDGGDFPNPTKSPLIRRLGLSADDHLDLIAFLLALTDDRVRYQRAPFDHPELQVPNGAAADGTDNMLVIPANGAIGGAELLRFLGLDPFVP